MKSLTISDFPADWFYSGLKCLGAAVLLFALGPDSVHAAVISTFSAIDNSLLDDIRGDAKRKDFVSPGSVELRTPFKNLSEHFQGATEPGYPQNRTLSDSYPKVVRRSE